MQIYKSKFFRRWASSVGLSDKGLKVAVSEIESGLIDADLGGFVLKKRIAIGGRGKRGGVRSVLVYKKGEVVFFIYGYSKNEKDNISEDQLKALKQLARELLSYDEKKIEILVKDEELFEVV